MHVGESFHLENETLIEHCHDNLNRNSWQTTFLRVKEALKSMLKLSEKKTALLTLKDWKNRHVGASFHIEIETADRRMVQIQKGRRQLTPVVASEVH